MLTLQCGNAQLGDTELAKHASPVLVDAKLYEKLPQLVKSDGYQQCNTCVDAAQTLYIARGQSLWAHQLQTLAIVTVDRI